MIKLIKEGSYRLIFTKDKRRMLFLGEQGYLWSHAKNIGELLSFSKHHHAPQYLLAQGEYKIYTVKDDPHYIDLKHLQLKTGNNTWQGYLLLTGLPSRKKVRSRIIPTREIIGNYLENVPYDTATTHNSTSDTHGSPS